MIELHGVDPGSPGGGTASAPYNDETAHALRLEGLAAGRTYVATIRSQHGAAAATAEHTFTTFAMHGLQLDEPGSGARTLRFRTNQPCRVEVDLAEVGGAAQHHASQDLVATSHAVPLAGLRPATRYAVRLRCYRGDTLVGILDTEIVIHA